MKEFFSQANMSTLVVSKEKKKRLIISPLEEFHGLANKLQNLESPIRYNTSNGYYRLSRRSHFKKYSINPCMARIRFGEKAEKG